MSWVYLDGKFVPAEEAAVSVYDHGLLYGDGVFEGIRAYNGRVFRLEEHVERLYDSAKAIMLEMPVTQEEMRDAILATLRKNGLTDAYIRPIVTRGVGDLGLDPRKCAKPTVIIISQKWEAMYGDLYEVGLTAITVTVRRNSSAALPPNIKSLNYLNNILAKIEANVKGGNEAIFLDDAGNVSEGSGDNIFVVKDGKIFTPHTLNNLKGITRKAVIEVAESRGYSVEGVHLGIFDLYTADEIFVTGTAAEVAPVTKIDGRVIGGGKPGPITRDLIEGFKEMTQNSGTPI
ncbi:MAG: branched-chain-amino-acid transaminase [Methanothrix sp.]|jgi:branched-chain amino acid aminotransferase|uniref:Branched-chain-amino-acid aminotransferase n=1 Tax=Methanothrix harundinacea TaxID=301375 RepID=A0A101IIN2_9EURY|nr:MAG: branched-chain amino acid aminotransferase [Methanosaeta sp. SDB]KUK44728.1 MAG: Branched-chain amino acid aminotransferase [Methanothrix harundinacea]MDD2638595.1 branched-chain-amino-acid transaminase [Methanothrix sp.]MDI9399024.1 branched-chain-amino-acid transaminase [Euryarchaeota archaeon]KUK95939.1 MAG: Branched-chain amino acid aminotransferase [Methanothrix harundinacea]